jgi:hypothetical protein
MDPMYLVLLAFPILGAGLKFIDDAFDERTFNKTWALILAPALGVLWAYVMIQDPIAATILLAVVLGVFLKGKIDNIAHGLGLGVIMVMILLAGVQLLYLPLILLIAAAVLDEVGNDVVDYNRGSLNSHFFHRAIIVFFDQRWLTKLTILYVVLLGLFPWYYFLAMLLFDGAYLVVRMYSKSRQVLLSSRAGTAT